MADTTTTNYGWVKPEITASNDTWGSKLNTNFDNIDSKVKTIDVPTAAAKAALVDADLVGSYDSAGAFAARKTTFAQFKASLPTMAQQNANAVAITGGTAQFTGATLLNTFGTAATAVELMSLRPTDFGAGKFGLFFNRTSANLSTIGVFDGVGNNGMLNLVATAGVQANGSNVMTVAGGTFTNVVTGTAFIAQGSLQVRNNSDRFIWLMNAAGTNRGAVVHNNALGSVDIQLYNTAGTYVRGASFRENGEAIWGGHLFSVGSGAGTAELRMNAAGSRDFRFINNAANEVYLQTSTDGWASAISHLRMGGGANSLFYQNLEALKFLPSGSMSYGADNGLLPGNGDAATFATHNVRLSSWNGVGLWDSSSNACRIVFNVRTGAMYANSEIGIGNARVFSDGNIQFTGSMQSSYGNYLSDALFGKAGYYTGSGINDTNFPLGQVLCVYTNTNRDRNQAYAVYLHSALNYAYTMDTSAGTQLAGTWRCRGMLSYSSGNGLAIMQRVA